MDLELISFPLCPFVQRAVITLREKGVAFEVRYIDLESPPDWFAEVSPMGKVPVLKVDGTVLFESAVIAEFLDETHAPAMMPADPLTRAQHRAWIEFGSNLLGRQYRMLTAAERTGFEAERDAARRELAFFEAVLGEGPLFAGSAFSLVDAAYAPFFVRLALMEAAHSFGLLEGLPKLAAWGEALRARPAVEAALPENFAARFRERFAGAGGWFGRFFA